jgi:hypothetical protein
LTDSEQQQLSESAQEPSELAAPPPIAQIDWYLQRLVALANEHEVHIGMTLVVGGSLVTGTLIGGKTYFDSFADAFTTGWPGDDTSKAAMRDYFGGPASMYGDAKSGENPQFIHLKNASVRTLQGAIPTNGFLWRGRISEVSGFSLGQIGEAPA